MATRMYVDLMNLSELEKFFQRVAKETILTTVDDTLNDFAERAVKEAKAEFGVYQPAKPAPEGGDFPAWAQLQQQTIDSKKVRTGEDVPLLDRGDLRESVEALNVSETMKLVGTYDQNGVYHEYGTSTIPARPWLRPVLWGLKIPFSTELRRRLIQQIKAKYPWTRVR
jgi:phage gpG-like protein